MSQIKVTEILVDHFATIADGIGGIDAELWNLKDFNGLPKILGGLFRVKIR